MNLYGEWAGIKANASNTVERAIAKLLLNSLYGKFAISDGSPHIGDEGGVCYADTDSCIETFMANSEEV